MGGVDLLTELAAAGCWCGDTREVCTKRGGCEWRRALDAAEQAVMDARVELDDLRRRLSALPTHRIGVIDWVALPKLLAALEEGGVQ